MGLWAVNLEVLDHREAAVSGRSEKRKKVTERESCVCNWGRQGVEGDAECVCVCISDKCLWMRFVCDCECVCVCVALKRILEMSIVDQCKAWVEQDTEDCGDLETTEIWELYSNDHAFLIICLFTVWCKNHNGIWRAIAMILKWWQSRSDCKSVYGWGDVRYTGTVV